jgi:hypothetical protein
MLPWVYRLLNGVSKLLPFALRPQQNPAEDQYENEYPQNHELWPLVKG